MKLYCFLLITILFISFPIFTENAINQPRWVTAESGLRMRESPDLNAKTMLTIPFGDEVTLLEEKGENVTISGATGKWSKIKWKDKEGWVFGGFLSDKSLTGCIEGSLSYPSDFIPNDMVIYAENISNGKKYSTDKHIKDKKYKYGTGYILILQHGEYYVYAISSAYGPEYKAYYSEFVTCGISVNCKSHKPIVVTVKINTTVSSIDPIDWYNY